ncbi:MAG: ATP-grasp domain-containing protein [Saprospiraceae bacterium]|nr:ATP-grasp domain-containing protein [Saprospiraceae bacterium]
MSHRLTVLILAGDVKGQRLITECKREGCRVFVLTRHALKDDDGWPKEDVDEFYYMPSLTRREEVINAVSYLARTEVIDRIIPLDDFDVEIASALREHLRVPGMGDTTARNFRDKLAMRMVTAEAGILGPEFVPILNHRAIHEYTQQVPGPWVLKPRSQAGAAGIKKIYSAEELWQKLNQMGDEQSQYLLERFVPGEIYHVDAITINSEVKFVEVSKYGKPPLEIIQGGGIFMTSVQNRRSLDVLQLQELNKKVLSALHFRRGVTHTEFIKSHADGKFYFLETAARVGGAYIADVIEHATDLNLWSEWAKIEIAGEKLPYKVPKFKTNYAGILLCLAKQEWPDMSGFDASEVVYKIHKKNHAGLIVASDDADRVQALMNEYSVRFANDFLAAAPQYEKIDR